jgi:hypothetical protein
MFPTAKWSQSVNFNICKNYCKKTRLQFVSVCSLLCVLCGRCNVSASPTDVSPTENSWMLHPLEKVSLGYFAPDRTIPSPKFDFLIFLIIILGSLYGCD